MKKLHKILVVIALVLSCFNLTAQVADAQQPADEQLVGEMDQNFVVRGKVVSAADEQPVDFALVFTEPYTTEVYTDQMGAFEIQAREVESIRIFKQGYKLIQLDADSLAAFIQPIFVNCRMEPISVDLQEVAIIGGKDYSLSRDYLRAVEGTAIYAGKKTEVIIPDRLTANLAANNPRQLYARVTGLNIWESDAAGLQLGIGGRGLSPDRTANFNTRQNGYDISADALGYPESYYTPPAEALKRIEVVRGAASLQYGTQFGGLLNFVLKDAPATDPFEGHFKQTFGAYGFFNSFNSLGGTLGDFTYYGYYQLRRGDGWRENSDFDQQNLYTAFSWSPSERFKISAAYTHMDYLARQAGGLTDQLFEEDPRKSIRDRNWFAVDWNIVNLNLDYQISPRTKLNWRNFHLSATKDALGYLGQINRADPGLERDLLSDRFKNFGSELRLSQRYNFFGNPNTVLIGGRLYNGQTFRQQGNADSTSLANFAYTSDAAVMSDFDFPSQNIALFTEHIIYLSPRLKLVPGVRFESINTASDGFFRQLNFDLAGNPLLDTTIHEQLEKGRSFLLAGAGLSYQLNKFEFYANYSQNYRAINFNDLRVNNPNLRVDEALEDERGFSADIGFRGTHSDWLNVDLSLFYLQYSGRIGQVLRADSLTFTLYRYRTNVADSRNIGLESYAEIDLFALGGRDDQAKSMDQQLSLFGNLSVVNASYDDEAQESAVAGKKVELVPSLTLRSGLNYTYKNFKASVQIAHTASQFTDATNAEFTPSAVEGIIPAYTVADFSASYELDRLSINGGINNFTNSLYFTRRASGYPGPGIIPADGRTWYIGLAVKI